MTIPISKIPPTDSFPQHLAFVTLNDFSALDWIVFLKAAQGFFQQDFPEGLQRWLHGIMEIAGAERCLFIVEKQHKLYVEAEEPKSDDRLPLPLEGVDALCQSIVHYVKKTQKYVLFSQGAYDGLFDRDSYIRERNTKSILAVPFFKQGTFLGMVYLENKLIANAFSPKRIEALQMMAQMAWVFWENEFLKKRAGSINLTY